MSDYSDLVIVVDDEAKVVRSLVTALSPVAKVEGFTDPLEVLEVFKKREVALVIADQRMAGMQGTELLETIKEISPNTVRFLLTGYADIQSMILAINKGQVHRYIEKPWDLERLQRDVGAGIEAYKHMVDSADRLTRLEVKSANLQEENLKLRDRIRFLGFEDQFLTTNPEMKKVLKTADRLAQAGDTVLIFGESGTGKELLAKRIHLIRHGPAAPFVALNCGALSEHLVESELFGHDKGAFTGAVSDFPGAFERADRGTVFLDEIGDLKPQLQVKLLRVIEEGKVRRLGGRREIEVNNSVLAATNQDLKSMVARGEFRRDLFFRLSVIELRLLPLRERPEDIALLLDHFREEAQLVYCLKSLRFTPAAVKRIQFLPFHGNVRELRSLVRSAAVVFGKDKISRDDVEELLRNKPALKKAASEGFYGLDEPSGGFAVAALEENPGFGDTSPDGKKDETSLPDECLVTDAKKLRKAREDAVNEVDRAFLEYWNRRCDGNVSEMARLTSLSRGHLYRMAKRCGFPLG